MTTCTKQNFYKKGSNTTLSVIKEKWAEARRKGEKVKKPQPVALSYFIRLLSIKVHSGKNFYPEF